MIHQRKSGETVIEAKYSKAEPRVNVVGRMGSCIGEEGENGIKLFG